MDKPPSTTSATQLSVAAKSTNACIAGVLCSVLAITFAIADANVLFQGALAKYIPEAVSLALIGAALLALILGRLTQLPGAIGGGQESMVIIIAATLSTVQQSLLAIDQQAALLPTAVAIIVLSSILVGVGLWLSGYFRVGRLIRYVPYPVMAGFLAGSGLLLCWFSLSIITGSELSPLDARFYQAQNLSSLAIAAALVVALQLSSGDTVHRFAMAGVLITAILGFHGISALLGYSSYDLQSQGWMIIADKIPAAYPPIESAQIALIDWKVIWQVLPQLLTLMIIATLGVLIKISALEHIFQQECDQEQELKATGWSNLISACAAGLPGFHVVGFGQISVKLQASSRGSSLVVATCLFVAAIFSGDILPLLPRAIFGGVALWLGVSMVIDYAIDCFAKINPLESMTVVCISAVIALAGFLPGLLCGIAFGLLLFVYEYSRQDVIRGVYNGTQLRSNVDRTKTEQSQLQQQASEVLTLRLHGYLFFGSTQRLYEQINTQASKLPTLNYLVLDFDKVTGLDITAVQSLIKLQLLTQRRNIQLWITGAEASIEGQLITGGIIGTEGFAGYCRQLDYALEHIENTQLGFNGKPSALKQAPVPLPADTQLRSLRAREYLLRYGQQNNALLIVQSGYFDVLIQGRRGSHRLRRCGPGSIIGEVSFFNASPVSADVIAVSDCSVWRISREQLQAFKQQQPQAATELHRQLAETLAQRLSDNSRQMAALV